MKQPLIRVIVADDHEIILDGLQSLFNNEAGIELLSTAKGGHELLELTRSLQPDVIITDLRMEGMSGIDIIKEISAGQPTVSCIIFSMFSDDYLIIEAAKAGALGYVTKGSKKEEIIEAVKSVHRKTPYYCPVASAKLIGYFIGRKDNAGPEDSCPVLTEEEKEIVRLICDGKTSTEIGNLLCKGRRWVELSRRAIIRKLQVKTPMDILKFALRTGLYSLTDGFQKKA